MIGLLAVLAGLQAEPEPPPCNDDRPVYPCEQPEPVVHLPAEAIGLPPLAASGSDGVRATMTASLGGPGILFQVTTRRNGQTRLFAGWFSGHPYSGWRELERIEIVVPRRAYRRLAARIDAALALPDECSDDVIILDGPMYRVERYAEGRRAAAGGGMCPSPGSGTVYALAAAFVCQQVDRSALPSSFGRGCQGSVEAARYMTRRWHLDR